MKIINILFLCFLITNSYTSNSAEMNSCNTEECKLHFKKFKNYARLGYADAMSALGEFYYHGYGTEKDLNKALSMFKRASKYGAYAAPVKVALLTLTEPSLKDTDEALKYLRKASRKKNSDANFLLGMIYYSKSFGDYDLELSDKHLSSAYLSKHQSINKFINYIKSKNHLTKSNFPTLISNIKSRETVKMKTVFHKKIIKDSYIAPPDSDDIEVVTIQGPTLEDIFNQQFEIFDSTYPDKTAGTGTMIAGRSCDEMMSCSTVSKQDFKRMLNYLD